MSPPDALAEAKRRLADGRWFPGAIWRVRTVYPHVLDRYLSGVMAEADPARRRRGLRVAGGWPLPASYASAGARGLERALATAGGRQGFVRAFVEHLIQHRERLPVADWLDWVVGFGGP